MKPKLQRQLRSLKDIQRKCKIQWSVAPEVVRDAWSAWDALLRGLGALLEVATATPTQDECYSLSAALDVVIWIQTLNTNLEHELPPETFTEIPGGTEAHGSRSSEMATLAATFYTAMRELLSPRLKKFLVTEFCEPELHIKMRRCTAMVPILWEILSATEVAPLQSPLSLPQRLRQLNRMIDSAIIDFTEYTRDVRNILADEWDWHWTDLCEAIEGVLSGEALWNESEKRRSSGLLDGISAYVLLKRPPDKPLHLSEVINYILPQDFMDQLPMPVSTETWNKMREMQTPTQCLAERMNDICEQLKTAISTQIDPQEVEDANCAYRYGTLWAKEAGRLRDRCVSAMVGGSESGSGRPEAVKLVSEGLVLYRIIYEEQPLPNGLTATEPLGFKEEFLNALQLLMTSVVFGSELYDRPREFIIKEFTRLMRDLCRFLVAQFWLSRGPGLEDDPPGPSGDGVVPTGLDGLELLMASQDWDFVNEAIRTASLLDNQEVALDVTRRFTKWQLDVSPKYMSESDHILRNPKAVEKLVQAVAYRIPPTAYPTLRKSAAAWLNRIRYIRDRSSKFANAVLRKENGPLSILEQKFVECTVDITATHLAELAAVLDGSRSADNVQKFEGTLSKMLSTVKNVQLLEFCLQSAQACMSVVSDLATQLAAFSSKFGLTNLEKVTKSWKLAKKKRKSDSAIICIDIDSEDSDVIAPLWSGREREFTTWWIDKAAPASEASDIATAAKYVECFLKKALNIHRKMTEFGKDQNPDSDLVVERYSSLQDLVNEVSEPTCCFQPQPAGNVASMTPDKAAPPEAGPLSDMSLKDILLNLEQLGTVAVPAKELCRIELTDLAEKVSQLFEGFLDVETYGASFNKGESLAWLMTVERELTVFLGNESPGVKVTRRLLSAWHQFGNAFDQQGPSPGPSPPSWLLDGPWNGYAPFAPASTDPMTSTPIPPFANPAAFYPGSYPGGPSAPPYPFPSSFPPYPNQGQGGPTYAWGPGPPACPSFTLPTPPNAFLTSGFQPSPSAPTFQFQSYHCQGWYAGQAGPSTSPSPPLPPEPKRPPPPPPDHPPPPADISAAALSKDVGLSASADAGAFTQNRPIIQFVPLLPGSNNGTANLSILIPPTGAPPGAAGRGVGSSNGGSHGGTTSGQAGSAKDAGGPGIRATGSVQPFVIGTSEKSRQNAKARLHSYKKDQRNVSSRDGMKGRDAHSKISEDTDTGDDFKRRVIVRKTCKPDVGKNHRDDDFSSGGSSGQSGRRLETGAPTPQASSVKGSASESVNERKRRSDSGASTSSSDTQESDHPKRRRSEATEPCVDARELTKEWSEMYNRICPDTLAYNDVIDMLSARRETSISESSCMESLQKFLLEYSVAAGKFNTLQKMAESASLRAASLQAEADRYKAELRRMACRRLANDRSRLQAQLSLWKALANTTEKGEGVPLKRHAMSDVLIVAGQLREQKEVVERLLHAQTGVNAARRTQVQGRLGLRIHLGSQLEDLLGRPISGRSHTERKIIELLELAGLKYFKLKVKRDGIPLAARAKIARQGFLG